MKEINYILLLERFMQGETSAEEEQQLLKWLRSSGTGEQLMDYYYEAWHNADDELSAEVQGRMFERIKSCMRDAQKEKEIKKPNLSPLFIRLLRYAAVVLLMLGAAIAGHFYTTRSDNNEYLVSTEKGQRANITLPDGTVVWLNSYTKLKYGTDYGTDKRIVSLNGEAFFEVAKDKKKPFIVRTEGMDVEALGTTFNVKAYDEDAKMVATLFSGMVRVSTDEHSVILAPNQDATFERSTKRLAIHKLSDSSHAKMWRDDELVFNGESLAEVAVMLNRLYNVQIIFTSERIKEYRFTGIIRNNSLDNVIELISLTSPITYKSKGDTIELNNR